VTGLLALCLGANFALLAAYIGAKKRLTCTIASYEEQLKGLRRAGCGDLELNPSTVARVLGSTPAQVHDSQEGFDLSELEAGTPRRLFIRSASKD
jgi:hypothetical protein